MLIGIVGFIGSGKGTVGELLVANHDYESESYAKALKDAAASIFSWNRAMLEGDTNESRFWREQRDRFWSEKLDIKNFTPRLALQWLGTEAGRRVFGENLWVAGVEKRWKEAGCPNTVITDCRFPNEIEMIRENDGKVIRIKRGPEPSWYQLMLFHNKGYSDDDDLEKIKRMRIVDGIPHESETAWIGCQIDEIILNEGTLNELEKKIADYVGGTYQASLDLE